MDVLASTVRVSAAGPRGSTPETRFLAAGFGAGILFGAVAINFAMLDWVMTLDPSWYSTMFGVLYIIGCGLMAMSFTVFVIRLIADRRPMRDVVSPGVLNDMGNLMFAFTLLWAYTNFSQFLIIWSGNIAEETPYYYVRNQGSWGRSRYRRDLPLFVPFSLLLRKIKRDVRCWRGGARLMVDRLGHVLDGQPMFYRQSRWASRPRHAPAPAPPTPEHQPASTQGTAEAPTRPLDDHAPRHAAVRVGEGDRHARRAGVPSREAPASTRPPTRQRPTSTVTRPGRRSHHVFEGLEPGIHWTDIPAFAGIAAVGGGVRLASQARPLLPPNPPPSRTWRTVPLMFDTRGFDVRDGLNTGLCLDDGARRRQAPWTGKLET